MPDFLGAHAASGTVGKCVDVKVGSEVHKEECLNIESFQWSKAHGL
jgi:hypothetical protein